MDGQTQRDLIPLVWKSSLQKGTYPCPLHTKYFDYDITYIYIRATCAAQSCRRYRQLDQLIQDMYDTLDRSEGIGLAAPQVGYSIRLVVINLDIISDTMPEYKGYIRTFINPHILEYDDTETDVSEEGCLSIPGIHESVRRPTRIRVTYLDDQFQPHDEWVDGYLARVMQHEFDHLEGVVFTDHLQGLRRQMTRSKLQAILKGRFSCNYKVKLRR